MQLGVLNAPWAAAGVPFEETLDIVGQAGAEAIEVGTGNFPPDAHCNPFRMNGSTAARKSFVEAITSRGMVLSGLSCHGNPLHPKKRIATAHHKVFVATVELAAKIRDETGREIPVIGFSGLPGGAPGDKVPNWVVAPWPDEQAEASEYQWETAVAYWAIQQELLAKYGVNMCFEMHPNFLVSNPASLLRLREACGDRMCCNFDPSHLWWQMMNPVAAIIALGEAIKHFHAKDCGINWAVVNVNGILDPKSYALELTRAWIFRTVGWGHDEFEWKQILTALRMINYDGVLSIEHEDSLMDAFEGFKQALDFLARFIIRKPASPMTWAKPAA